MLYSYVLVESSCLSQYGRVPSPAPPRPAPARTVLALRRNQTASRTAYFPQPHAALTHTHHSSGRAHTAPDPPCAHIPPTTNRTHRRPAASHPCFNAQARCKASPPVPSHPPLNTGPSRSAERPKSGAHPAGRRLLHRGQPRGEVRPGPAQRAHRAGPPELGPCRVQTRPLPAVVGLGVRTRVEVRVIGHEQGFGDEARSAYLPTHYLPADRGRTGACAAARAASASRLAVNS